MSTYQKHRLAKPERYAVLIIDDDADCRSLYSRRLLNEGYIISTACDGEEAIRMLSIEQYDVILLDLEMPRLNGFGFLEWITQNQPDHGAHIIVLSSTHEKETVMGAMNLGATDYVIKSTSPLELLKRIQRACLVRKIRNELPVYPVTAPLSEVCVYVVDHDELNRRLISRHFEHHQIAHKAIGNSFDLLSELQKRVPDLLLLDTMMPDLDGIDSLRAIREIYPPHEIAIIMLSSLDNPAKIDECYRLGADDYISKPFNAAELMERVKAVLNHRYLILEKSRLDELSTSSPNLRSH